MKILTLYTLYGRRAGAELCFEKTVQSIYEMDKQTEWVILCNLSALEVVKKEMPFANPIYVKWLDNQYKKAFWIEFLSKNVVNTLNPDCFWIPSGCNHFPGKWDVPVLSTFHDLGEYHVINKYGMARMFYRKNVCIPLNVKRATRFTAVSEFTKQDMVNFLSMEAARIKVIYNGSTPHTVAIPRNSEQIVANFGLQKGAYFFTPGRTDFIGKGLDILLEAFKQFSVNHKDVFLVLTGPQGEDHQKLINVIEKDPLKNRVLYLGRVDNDVLVSLYRHSLATVIASRFEGFGFPVLEAMRFDTPIICSDAGSLREIAGDAAVIFHSGDSNALKQKLLFMYEASQTIKNQLIKKGKARLNAFSWEKCAEQMLHEFSLCHL